MYKQLFRAKILQELVFFLIRENLKIRQFSALWAIGRCYTILKIILYFYYQCHRQLFPAIANPKSIFLFSSSQTDFSINYIETNFDFKFFAHIFFLIFKVA